MCSIGCIVLLLEAPRICPRSYRCSGNITVVPLHFGSRGTWLRTYARELVKMLLIFMIRVGSSVGNLAKDWKGQLMEAELQSLQYEVSLNGVREEIRHVLDSEIARHGQLTPHQMYEVVKRYETYIAHNKCLKGKSASPHVGHQRAAAQTSGYKPHFHKTTAFAASVEESPDPALSEQGPSLPEDDDHLEGEPTQEEDEGLYIQGFLEEALGGDGNLQIKMAHILQAQERHNKKCFICQSGDHLMKDHYKVKMGWGPYSQRGLSKTSQLGRWPKPLHLVKQCLREPLQSEGCTLSKS